MNKTEKVDFTNSCENYMEEKQLRDLFRKLTKKLVLYQPEDPIDFLIEQLETKNNQRLFFLIGYSLKQRNKIANNIGLNFNLKVISFPELLQKEITNRTEYYHVIQSYLNQNIPGNF